MQQKVDLEEELLKVVKTDDGKFRSHEPSCSKVFLFNGKRKRDHEWKAHSMQSMQWILMTQVKMMTCLSTSVSVLEFDAMEKFY